MQGKKLYIILGVVALVVVAGVGYLLFGRQPEAQDQQQDQQQTATVKTLSPKDVGLTMEQKDQKQVKFTLSKPQGISSIDYELTYTAQGGQDRGVIGTIQVTPEDKTVESKYLDLGSCSSGVCKYDKGVSSVHLLLKLTKTDGSTAQVEDNLNL